MHLIIAVTKPGGLMLLHTRPITAVAPTCRWPTPSINDLKQDEDFVCATVEASVQVALEAG